MSEDWHHQESMSLGPLLFTLEDAPQVEIQESGEGLVESVEGKEAGQIGYAHKGEMLTAVDAPQGETA